MDLNNLMSKERWLEFGQDFCDHSGLNAFAFDENGDHVLGKGNWANQLCPVIRGQQARTESICTKSFETLSEIARREKQIVVSTCDAGMLILGVPVFVGGEYIGLVGGCGLRLPGAEEEPLPDMPGLDEQLASRLAKDVGAISRERTETWARYLEDRIREIVARYKRGSTASPSVKTFKDLITEVQRLGLCHQCGGCVTFCSAMNYGALELSETGRPRYRDPGKCIQCGICYMICPEISLLDKEMQRKFGWREPAGNILETTVVRARDPEIRERATDGGAVTAILSHLFDTESIDGAAVTRQMGPFKRQPWLAANKAQVLESAGSNFDRSQSSSVTLYTQDYSTYSPSVRALGPVKTKGLERVALVGTPCQINTIRKMQTLGVTPSDSIFCTLGLFCSGNYIFGDKRREKIERIGNFKWAGVEKINIKDECIIRLKNGEVRTIPLEDLDFVKRRACRFCGDYAAEYADIAFGGIGAEEGWTTVVARTELGRDILNEAKTTVLEEHPEAENVRSKVEKIIARHSRMKRDAALDYREEHLAEDG